MCVSAHVRAFVRMCVCVCIRVLMFVCLSVHGVCVCVYVHLHTHLHTCACSLRVSCVFFLSRLLAMSLRVFCCLLKQFRYIHYHSPSWYGVHVCSFAEYCRKPR